MVFLLQVMRFAKLNKLPLSIKPPPQKCLKKISPPGGLMEDLRYVGIVGGHGCDPDYNFILAVHARVITSFSHTH